MPADFTLEQIAFELTLSETPADIKRQFELEKTRKVCQLYSITYSELWITFSGRIAMAQIIAAKLGRDERKAKELQREWLTYLEADNG